MPQLLVGNSDAGERVAVDADAAGTAGLRQERVRVGRQTATPGRRILILLNSGLVTKYRGNRSHIVAGALPAFKCST